MLTVEGIVEGKSISLENMHSGKVSMKYNVGSRCIEKGLLYPNTIALHVSIVH